jgi:GPI mannosyltransferase 4
MFRRAYLLLIFVRIYFALSPSYLHPDETFQGPEVIAGMSRIQMVSVISIDSHIGSLFGYPSRRTWEWTVAKPIRSVFPLWPAYGLPMVMLQWLWPRGAQDNVEPTVIYYTLRVVMFILSFVLEDWAIHELVHSPRYQRQAVVLVASSYVTWTYQTHTFSNSVETLIVLWSLVLIERICHEQVCEPEIDLASG